MVLYHGHVPLNADGSFRQVKINGKKYAGRLLCDVLEHHARQGYFEQENSPKKSTDRIMRCGTYGPMKILRCMEKIRGHLRALFVDDPSEKGDKDYDD